MPLEGESATRASVTVGPFAVFFTNVNRAMGLPGHSHFALVTLHYRTAPGAHGFPAFAATYAAVQTQLMALTARAFHDATNEDIVAALWTAFVEWRHPAVEQWGGSFALAKLELAVRGVPDAIGHADGFTTYTVERIA
jgi:hypothetical protein